MGMFDSVVIECPACSDDVTFQSKAGPCGLHLYRADEVPAKIAEDLTGQREVCGGCGHVVTLAARSVVRMTLVAS